MQYRKNRVFDVLEGGVGGGWGRPLIGGAVLLEVALKAPKMCRIRLLRFGLCGVGLGDLLGPKTRPELRRLVWDNRIAYRSPGCPV